MSHSSCGSEQSTCYISDAISVSTSESSSHCTGEGPGLNDCIYGCDFEDSLGVPRGWSMRHGHSKRLARPKTGKAAIWAEIQGQGKEVLRGRSVFKRSVNPIRKGYRRAYKDDYAFEQKQRMQACLRQEIVDDYALYLEDQGWSYEQDEDEPSLHVQDMDTVAKVTPTARMNPLDSFCNILLRQNTVVDILPLKSNNAFAKLQKAFLMKHGKDICRNLHSSICGSSSSRIKLKPAAVSADVQHRFSAACAVLPGTVRPAFHGTSSVNFPSIFERGFLIPGQDNELRVANGSVHGLGIYTASVNSPSLSWGFCSDQKMLVCGLLDDANMAGHKPYTLGRQDVVAESESVRHVGSAMVVFDHRRVAPLFEVSCEEQAKPFVPLPIGKFNWARHAMLLARLTEQARQKPSLKLRFARTVRIGQYRQLLQQRKCSNTPASFLARRGARKRRLHGI